MRLSPAQVQAFSTDGFLRLRGALGAADVAQLRGEFEATMEPYANGFNRLRDQLAGEQHDGSSWTFISGGIEHTRHMCALLDDLRIKLPLESLLGPGFNYAGGDSALYTGDTSWHVDNDHCLTHGSMFSIKLAIYLDEQPPGRGCLRVHPGSHRASHPLRLAVAKLGDAGQRDSPAAAAVATEFPGAVDVPSTPGDIVLFNHDLWHGSFGGGARRRMFTINCTRRARTTREWKTLERYVREHTPGAYDVRTGAGMYFPLMLQTAAEVEGASSERQRHLEQLHRLHDQLFPHLSGGQVPSFSPSQPPWSWVAEAHAGGRGLISIPVAKL